MLNSIVALAVVLVVSGILITAGSLITGLGDDTVNATDSTLTGPLTINSGGVIPFLSRLFRPDASDIDNVTVATTTVRGAAIISLGDGNDTLGITGGSVAGAVNLNGGAHACGAWAILGAKLVRHSRLWESPHGGA